jgi:hypothetical protein
MWEKLAGLISAFFFLLSVLPLRADTFIPISQYPNVAQPPDWYLEVLAEPGVTNYNWTLAQRMQYEATNLDFTSVLASNANFWSSSFLYLAGSGLGSNLLSGSGEMTSGQFFLTTQTNLLFDYAAVQSYQVFSTYTGTAPVAFALTNIVMPTNGAKGLTIVLRNLSSSNLLYSFPAGISWVWQVNTNCQIPTNIFGGQVQQIQLFCLPTVGTNTGVVGSVNP